MKKSYKVAGRRHLRVHQSLKKRSNPSKRNKKARISRISVTQEIQKMLQKQPKSGQNKPGLRKRNSKSDYFILKE